LTTNKSAVSFVKIFYSYNIFGRCVCGTAAAAVLRVKREFLEELIVWSCWDCDSATFAFLPVYYLSNNK